MRRGGIRHRLLGEREPALEPFGLRLCGLHLHAHAVELLGLRGKPGIEFAERGQRGSRPLLGDLEAAALLGQGETGRVEEGGDPAVALVRGVPVGDELEARALGARPAAQHPAGEHVARLGDDGGVSAVQVLPGGPRGGQVVGDEHRVEQ